MDWDPGGDGGLGRGGKGAGQIPLSATGWQQPLWALPSGCPLGLHNRPPHPPSPTLPAASRGGKMWQATIQGLVGAHLWGRRLPDPRGLPAEGGAGGS